MVIWQRRRRDAQPLRDLRREDLIVGQYVTIGDPPLTLRVLSIGPEGIAFADVTEDPHSTAVAWRDY